MKFCQQSGVFLWEKFQKNFERISSHHWSDMSNVPYKVRVNRINIVWVLLLLSVPKKGKEALRTRLSGSKLTWTETFVRSIKFTKWKTTLNWGILASYENLPIKTTLKKRAIFCVCNCDLPLPQISRFRKLLHLSSNNSENTNHRHLLITVILDFLKIFTFKETTTHFRTINFTQSPGSNFQAQFWMDCMFPLIAIISSCENSLCVLTATQVGWLPPILFYTREQSDEYYLPVKLKWGWTNVCQKL